MAKRRGPKPLWRRIAGGALYALVCAMALTAGTAWRWLGESPMMFDIVKESVPFMPRTEPRDVFNRKSVNLLVLGCDEDRMYGGKTILRHKARADMILVARLDFEKNQVTGVSIPRDTLVAIPGYREQKINAYHSIGESNGKRQGKMLQKQAVEALLGIKIDRVVVLDYKAMQEMVDLVGGVEVYVDKPLKYTDVRGDLHIDLKPGKHVLNGYQAMGFVRIRKVDDDMKRQERQKDFLLAFKNAFKENWSVAPQVINKSVEALSGDLTEREMVALAAFAKGISSDNVRLGMVPVVPAYEYNLRVDRSKLLETLVQFDLVEVDYPQHYSYRQ